MHTPETCRNLGCEPNKPHHAAIPAGVNWYSETWGGVVHEDSHGSWLPDRHDVPRERRGALRLASPSDQAATWRDSGKGDPS